MAQTLSKSFHSSLPSFYFILFFVLVFWKLLEQHFSPQKNHKAANLKPSSLRFERSFLCTRSLSNLSGARGWDYI
jgi:hypothetical protein